MPWPLFNATTMDRNGNGIVVVAVVVVVGFGSMSGRLITLRCARAGISRLSESRPSSIRRKVGTDAETPSPVVCRPKLRFADVDEPFFRRRDSHRSDVHFHLNTKIRRGDGGSLRSSSPSPRHVQFVPSIYLDGHLRSFRDFCVRFAVPRNVGIAVIIGHCPLICRTVDHDAEGRGRRGAE